MMVAVLAIPLTDDDASSKTSTQLPSPPPGTNHDICTVIGPRNDSSKGSSVFFSEVEDNLLKYQRAENLRRSMSIGSFTSIVEGSDSNETDDSSWEKMPGTDRVKIEGPSPISTTRKMVSANAPPLPIPEIISNSNDASSNSNSGVSTPIRKIKLYGGGREVRQESSNKSNFGNYKRKKKRTVIVHSSEVSKNLGIQMLPSLLSWSNFKLYHPL